MAVVAKRVSTPNKPVVTATTLEDAQQLQQAMDAVAKSLTASLQAEANGDLETASAATEQASKTANHLALLIGAHSNRTRLLLEEASMAPKMK